MRKFTLLVGLLLVFGLSTFAQTKRIVHRSHSGSHSNYIALEKADNLGNPISPEFINKLYPIDSFAYFPIDSIRVIRVSDSLKNVRMMDSLKKLRSTKKLKDTLPTKQLGPVKNIDALKIQELKKKESHKKQGFPLPLLLLIAVPTLAIVFVAKYLKQ